MNDDITHREIYERLVAVEGKVDALTESTKDVISAFQAARGAFVALEMLARLVKPLLWIAGVLIALGVFWDELVRH
jgi:hypothetical protein